MGDILQEQLKQLHVIFQQKDPSRHTQAAKTVQDVVTLALDISHTEATYCSSLVFNEEFGLLKFLKLSVYLKEFEGVKADIFRFLVEYCDNHVDRSLTGYVKLVRDCCVSCYMCDHSVKVKTEALNVLLRLISLNGGNISEELKIPELISKFFSECIKSSKFGSTLRCILYSLMGEFAERYPELMTEISDRLLSVFLSFLKLEMQDNKRKVELLVIAGCLKGLTGYLVNFTQSVSEGSKFSHEIYKYTKKVLTVEKINRYDALKAALNLLKIHCAQFKELITEDAEEVYNALERWSNHDNKDLRDTAISASDAILLQIATCISEMGKEKSQYAKVLKDFMVKFHNILNSPKSTSKEITRAVKGYGKFAGPSREFFSDKDMNMIFEQILQRSQQCYSNMTSVKEDGIHQLPTFLEALSRIIKTLKEISPSSISSMENIVISLFEYYPLFGKTGQNAYHDSFTMFIEAISSSLALVKSCLPHVIYQCLVRTISHVPVEIASEELSDVSKKNTPISYKTFLPVWCALLDYKRYKASKLDEDTKAMALKEQVYDDIILAVLSVLKKLNLNSEKVSASEEGEEMSSGKEFDVSSDPTVDLVPEMPKDFQILINLVDFCKSLLVVESKASFRRWIYVFVEDVITLSTRYPVVSGFYKLMQIASCLIEENGYIDSKTDLVGEQKQCLVLICNFIKHVVAAIKQYKGDLLISCLQFVLSLPVEIVQGSTQLLVPVFLSAFQLGLSYFELADLALTTLLKWNSHLSKEEMHPVLSQVLPLLDDFLQSVSTDDTEDAAVETVTLNVSERKLKRIPIRYLKALISANKQVIESPLKKLRWKIVRFLGSLGGQSNILLLKNGGAADLAKAMAWDDKKHLSFALPFKDMKPTIYLDTYLPRVVELVLTSSNRQTKVVACELLHALVLFMLGKSVQQASGPKKDSLERLYRKVFPALIKLGCSSEQVAEQLFSPLVFQIIHWLTGNTKHESPETMALLDSILDGVTSSSDNSLRDFSAKCVKEFFSWSIKQTSEKQLEKYPANPKSLFKRMYSLALHPQAFKRLGATVVFNNIYTVFREEVTLVDTFTLEALVVFINSLSLSHKDEKSLGTIEQCEIAIGHLERIVMKKNKLLLKANPTRNKPVRFSHIDADAFNLIHVNVWILQQCGSSHTACRHQCMKLVTSFLPLQTDVSTTREWMMKTIEMEVDGAKYFTDKFEKGSYAKCGIRSYPTLDGRIGKIAFSIPVVVNWLENFLGALDCYCWVLGCKLIPSVVLLVDNDACNVMKSIVYFLDNLVFMSAKSLSEKYATGRGVLPSESDIYNRSKCTVVVRIFNFLKLTLSDELWKHSEMENVAENIFSTKLFKLVSHCILSPQYVGFNVFDMEILKNLPLELQSFSGMLLKHSSSLIKEKYLEQLSQSVGRKEYDITQHLPLDFCNSITRDDNSLAMIQVVSGYTLLLKAGLLQQIVTIETLNRIQEGLLKSIANNLTKLAGDNTNTGVIPLQKVLANHIVELLLLFETSFDERLLTIMFDEQLAWQSKGLGREESRGCLFHHLFRDILHGHVMKNPTCVPVIVSNGMCCGKLLLNFLQGLISYCFKMKEKSSHMAMKVCTEIVNSWPKLMRIAGTDVEMNTYIIYIAKPLLQISSASIKNTHMFNSIISVFRDNNAHMFIKEVVIDMLPYVLSKCDEDQVTELKKELISLIANRFPISSKDLAPGSSSYLEYMSCLKKMLIAMEVSLKPVLFEVLVGVIIRETQPVYEKTIEPSLISFICKLDAANVEIVFDYCLVIFNDDVKYPNVFRRGVIERICVPVLYQTNKIHVKCFFEKNKGMLASLIENRFDKISEEVYEQQIVTKICCFKLITVMFQMLGKDEVLSKPMSRAASVFKEKYLDTEIAALTELRRQFSCAAYNCLIVIISSTQTDAKFYSGLLFKENPSKGSYIFENIIDAEKTYTFESELDLPLRQKKTLQLIRSVEHASSSSSLDVKRHTNLQPYNYISSQYLMGTSLSQDVSQFDFNIPADAYANKTSTHDDVKVEPLSSNNSTLISAESENRKESETIIDLDDLNQHECMSTLLAVMEHMAQKKIYPVLQSNTEASEIPDWMDFLRRKMLDRETKIAIKLFVAKMIINEPKIFEPFGAFFFSPLVDLILGGNIAGPPMNYMAVDIIVVMLSWSTTIIPEDSVIGRNLASSLLDYVFKYSHHSNRTILKNNLQIVKTMMVVWKDRLEVSYKIIHEFFRSTDEKTKDNATGIQLLGITLECSFPPYRYQIGLTEREFFTDFVRNVTFKYKEVFESTAEVCSLALKHYKDHDYSPDVLLDILTQYLMQFSKTMKDRFVICLHRIHQFYPEIVDSFISPLLYCVSSLHGLLKTQCMQCLAARVIHLEEEHQSIFTQLKGNIFEGMLKHRDEEAQIAMLQVITGILKSLSMEEVLMILPKVALLRTNNSKRIRELMYDLFMWVYEKYAVGDDHMDTEARKQIISITREILLLGINDSNTDLNLKVLNFWRHESRLSNSTIGRLIEILLALYLNKTEKEYLHYATNLIMQLTSLSPDYSRPLFDSGLDSEENFRNYHVNFSWQRQNVAMTPLFASSQRSTQQGTYSHTQGSTLHAGILRGTQKSMEFTQTNPSFNWMNPSMQVTSESFASSPSSPKVGTTVFPQDYLKDSSPSNEPNGADGKLYTKSQEILKLKNKYNRYKNSQKTSGYHYASIEINKKKMRELAMERRKAARDRKVVMYRKYRLGELPDIQIKHSELIVSLQALAQLDSHIAKLLFCDVSSSIISVLPQVLSEDDVTNAYSDIQRGLRTMLKTSTMNSPSFVGAVENVFYANKEFSADPETISRVSMLSLQQPLGILLLEKQLLTSVDVQTSKRRKTRDGHSSSESMKPWMELAKMYESIKDYDFLRSIFSSHVSVVDLTRDALACEARNDFQRALDLYRQASAKDDWDNSPTEEEVDYWDGARLRCYEHLGKWPTLKDFTLKSIEQLTGEDNEAIDLRQIWNDELLQDTYLPCYMKSNLKLLCQGKIDEVHAGFIGFVEDSLQRDESKDYLQSRFCDELALLNILKDSFGISQHYINISIQNFLDEWSHVSKLVAAGRHNQLERLQKIVEMEEFVSFMASDDCRRQDKVEGLVSLWRSRVLDKKIHDTLVWDDIMLNRCAYIRKLKSKFQDNRPFCKYLNIEEIRCILSVADVARKQGNFSVASQYLNDSLDSLDMSDASLSVQWRHIYVKIHLDRGKVLQRGNQTNIPALITATSHLDKCKPSVTADSSSRLTHDLLEFDVLISIANGIKYCNAEVFESIKDGVFGLLHSEDTPTIQVDYMEKLHTRGFDVLHRSLENYNPLLQGNSESERKLHVKALMKIIVFCDECVKEGVEQSVYYAQLVVENLLKAMKLNSQKARSRFPRLLQIIESHSNTREKFMNLSTEVPCWMYLGWINQIVALIDKPLQACVAGVLNMIAVNYPQALMYPLCVSGSQYQFTDDADGQNRKNYYEKLTNKVTSPILEPFSLALGQLTSPRHVFKDFLAKLQKEVTSKNRANIEACYKEYLLEDTGRGGGRSLSVNNVSLGSFSKNFKQKYAVNIEKELGKDGKKLIGMTSQDFIELRRRMNRLVDGERKCVGTLKQFSPWLSEFQGDHFRHQLEIPGQYDGQIKPLVEYHVKIAGFDERILTLPSLREPKCLKIRGDDEKEYKFLVKGGEDLRLDQRIEQVFELMNEILRNDPVCSNRSLELKTYKVVPLTSRVGIIEWVDNTVPYKTLLDGVMTEHESKVVHGTNGSMKKFRTFVSKYGCNDVSYDNLYKAATLTEVQKSHDEIVATVPWDLLRRAFTQMAASSEAYFVLRSHFVQSHSCMCIAQYLLGIGDRHRSNTLIDKLSGGVVGIDFGHAFGTAVQIIGIPELMPFRLTKQMLNLLLPLNDASPYKQAMVAVLQAFRKHSNILLNTMDVFIKEPLLDWQGYASKQAKAIGVSQDATMSSWYPQHKIGICRQKLCGINPAYITAEELRIGHSSRPIHKAFMDVAKGIHKYNVRKRLLDETKKPEEFYLTVEEQVDCLIDQATDPSILGRTYYGWEAWI